MQATAGLRKLDNRSSQSEAAGGSRIQGVHIGFEIVDTVFALEMLARFGIGGVGAAE